MFIGFAQRARDRRGPHQGSSLVPHKGLEPSGRTLDPFSAATLARPVVPDPSLPADNKIIGSAFQLVLIPDLFADGGPIVFVEVFQFVDKRITLLDAREWEIPEQMINEGMKTGTSERYLLGFHAIHFQSENIKTKYIKYAEYAEYTE